MANTSSKRPAAAPVRYGLRAIGRHWEAAAAALIVAGALAIRLWGLRGGLPYVDHPDEPNPINYVVQMLRTGDLNPHFFQKPSLYVYMLLGVLALHYRLGLQSGLYGALDQMTVTTHVFTTIPEFFFWGRMLTVALGGLTVAGVYALGRRAWSAGAGLVGALFLATAQFHMRHSQYVTTDVASGLLVLLAFLLAVAVARGGRWRDYLLAGLLAGLAASTKYNAGVVALTIVAAHGLRWGRESLRRGPRLVSAGAASLLGFLIGTPYALLSWPEFSKGLLGQWGAYNDGPQGDISGAWPIGGYASFFWNDALLAPACLAVLAGVVLLVRRRRAVGLVWLSFAIPYLLLLLAQSTHFMRNLIPLFVLCMLPLGAAADALIGWLAARAPRYRGALAALALALLLAPTSAATLSYLQRLDRGDTRVHMLAWLDAHVPPGARIAAELRPLPGPLESPWAEVGELTGHDLAWYRRQGYAYLIASSDAWRQWALPEPYARLAGGPPAAEFGGASPREMFGPHLVIYATGLSAADVPSPLAGDVRVGGARLLGSAIGSQQAGEPARALKAGDTLALRSFWQVEQPFAADYFIFVHVLNQAGETVARRDAPPWQGRYPTSSWRPGTLVVDANDLALPPELPAGEYAIVIGMFDPATGANPPALADGQPIPAGAVEIGRITVAR
ncbi:MAG: glycosyltransferase family 39 protein [Kouleothrix sp.]|nr:glycosyltransferase family 39 protein [Kouleothrix sp.]